MVTGIGFRIGIEAETRARDGQELERRIATKQRDGAVAAVILLLADTRSNRQFLQQRSASFDEHRYRSAVARRSTRWRMAQLRAGTR